tara:strand:- start:57 stop:728 length:672 start_codon:yes stop_codon:yes gene_type:complete
MDNVFLHTHIGGDGSHFLIWLLGQHTDSVGDQRDPDGELYDKYNGYIGIDHVIKHPTNNADSSWYVSDNIWNGRKWNEGLELRDYITDDKVWIQQHHATPSLCPSNCFHTEATPETQFYITQLDAIKNEFTVTDDWLRDRGNCFLDTFALGISGVAYNYENFIIKNDINEFENICSFIGTNITSTTSDIIQDVKLYHKKNQTVLALYDKLQYNKHNFKTFIGE